MKKFYEGAFYVYEDGVVNYNSGNYATMLDTDVVDFANVTTADKMTAKNVLDNTFKGLNDAGREIDNDDFALKYVAPNGETTLMWAVQDNKGGNKNFLTRGKSYKVVFDQEGIATDDITAASRKDVEATDSVEAPYVTAPAGLVLETAAYNQNAVVNFVDADGNKLAWMGASNAASAPFYDDDTCGIDYMSIYGNSESKTDGAERAASGGTTVKGVWTSDYTLSKDKTIYYAEAKSLAGVYGEKAVTLRSDFKTKNIQIASSVSIAEDGAVPTSAKITLKDVAAPGKVYVYNEDKNVIAFDPDDSSTYRGYAEVKVGQGEAIVSSVFKKDEVGDDFVAVLVPDDEAAYAKRIHTIDSTITTSDNVPDKDLQTIRLLHKPTTVEYVVDAEMAETGIAGWSNTNNITFTDSFVTDDLTVKDQFGNVINNTRYLETVTKKSATVTPINGGGTYTEKGGATYSYDGSDLTIYLESNAGVDAGDGFKVTLMGATFELKSAFAAPFVDGQKPFGVKIGTDVLATGSLNSTTPTVMNNSQLALAAANPDVTQITLGDSFNVTSDIAVGAVTVVGNGKTLTIADGKTLTFKGTTFGGGTTATLTGAGNLVLNGNTYTDAPTISNTGNITVYAADDFEKAIGNTSVDTVIVAASMVSDDANIGEKVEILQDVVFTVGADMAVNSTITIDAKTTGTAAGKVNFEATTGGHDLTIGTAGSIVNNGTFEITTGTTANTVVNNGVFTDTGVVTIANTSTFTNKKTATFAGTAGTTNATAGGYLAGTDSVTTFTAAPTANFVITEAADATGDTFSITVAGGTTFFKNATTATAVTEAATFGDAAHDTAAEAVTVKDGNQITIIGGTSTYTTTAT